MGLLVTGVITGAAIAGIIVIAPAVKQATDLAPFLYANTRCSARTGALLTHNTYSEMLASSSVTELYGVLEDTAYAPIVEHAKDFVNFSSALDKQLNEDYEWLKGIVPKDIVPIIKVMQLRFEINDIKAMLNNLRHGKSGEYHFVRNENLRFKLQSATDFQTATSALEGTPYHDIFIAGSLEKCETITTKLDYYYITKVQSTIRKAPKKSVAAFAEYWRHMIDLYNVRLVMRKIERRLDEVKFIEGGFISPKALSGVTDNTQLEGVLRDSPYNKYLTEMTPLEIETSFARAIKNLAGLLNARHPLQAGYVVRYIVLKEHELKTVNLISKLKEEKFPEEEIRKLAQI